MQVPKDSMDLVRVLLPAKKPALAAQGHAATNQGAAHASAAGAKERVSLSPEAAAASSQSVMVNAMNDKVREMFEAYGIEEADTVGLDFSPGATAQRIFDFSAGMMDIYRGQNPELGEEELIDKFESTIRGAVDSGYGEAIDILNAMSMPEDVMATAEETKGILDGLFDDFFNDLRAPKGEAEA